MITQKPTIYRLDLERKKLRDKTSVEAIIEEIINRSFEKQKLDRKYEEKALNKFHQAGLTYYLYTFNTEEFQSDWRKFFPSELKEGSNFIQQKLSLILFIQSEFDIHCIIGGNAYRMIVPYIDHSFGLNTYSKIIDPSKDDLVSIRTRGLTGLISASNDQFRDNYRIRDFIKFGKVTQDIHLILSQSTTDLYFGFLKSRKKERLHISAGKGFKIKKAIDFKSLHNIIVQLKFIRGLAENEYLSSFSEISDKKEIAEFLYPELLMRIFNDAAFVGNSRKSAMGRFDYDLCNPNSAIKFYEADEYVLKFKTENGGWSEFKRVDNRSDIYEEVLKHVVQTVGLNDFVLFKSYLWKIRVTAEKGGKTSVTNLFLYHISTEFPYKKRPVFLVDTKWYHLRDSFIKDVEEDCVDTLKTYKSTENILPIPWNKDMYRKEKLYNLAYDSKENYIVIDTIISEGIELCDLIYYTDDTLYLIHVKYSFRAPIRELHNQITISARRLKEALGTSDKKLLDKIYKQLLKKGRSTNDLTKDGFKSLFQKRKIIYVLAFASHLKTDLDVSENIERYSSNIARFSVVQCSKEMRAMNGEMHIHQIATVRESE